ncbi:MAG: peptidylprolyl isomerase [Phycisphaeraceae bacterium]
MIQRPIATLITIGGLICLCLPQTGCNDAEKNANLPHPEPTYTADVKPNEIFAATGRDAVAQRVQTPADQDNYTVDAMVGQINGQPIYASRIFHAVGEEQLSTLGKNRPRRDFQQQAGGLLAAKLREIVTNELILAEAQAGLSKQEEQGLLGMLQKYREDVISRFGGTIAMTEEGLMKSRGVTLQQAVEEHRQTILIQKYLRDKLYPKVFVDRREVVRYYNEHPDQYHPAPAVYLRLIRARDEKTADEIDDALKADQPFEQVAKQYSTYRAEAGGVVDPAKVQLADYNVFAWAELNQAVRGLQVGRHTPRVTLDKGFGWAYLEKVEEGKVVPLHDVYLEIEQILRAGKFDQLQRRYLADLLKKGNYTPVEQMMQSLITVATNRYAQPE